MNPRQTLDALGQRLQALIFRSLTRIDKDLNPQGDLADGWKVAPDGLHWTFHIRPGLVDQERHPIDAHAIGQCLENYRTGKPTSPYKSSFPTWRGTTALAEEVTLDLEKPDPFLARNVSLLRYFRKPGAATPCEDPGADPTLIGSGRYRPLVWGVPEGSLTMMPVDPTDGAVPIRFEFIKDYTTMVLKFLRGELDAGLNALSQSNTRFIQHQYADRFDVLERAGVNLGYMAFNLRDPLLARPEIRRAIAIAIDRDDIIQHHLFNFGTKAGSFLPPLVPDAVQTDIAYDPREAERILDHAGFPRGKNGVRLELHYKATPAREGIEQAQIIQNMLEQIGIRLEIDVVEPAVFFASLRKGSFQLFCSRWLGISDGSILRRTLYSGERSNYAGYHNPEMDAWLDQAGAEPNDAKRRELLQRIQRKMAEDLPYFPLWEWNNALVLRKGIRGLQASDLSLSGSFEPLTHLRPF